ncbi:MAG: hypothetical protein ACRDDH_00100, partial [Cetobacterium sp.]|uniref:hypothetical protein n=1 Tax=Cetobacterium sp. TaxID=2071632 RepID=UPI003EE51871
PTLIASISMFFFIKKLNIFLEFNGKEYFIIIQSIIFYIVFYLIIDPKSRGELNKVFFSSFLKKLKRGN